MSSELQKYEQGGEVAVAPEFNAPTELDQWVLVVRDVSRLASQIADTPFVPEGMRGNPAAVTAAILTGREMGLPPMTSLQHIHVIKGKPGKSAEIMRGMVLAAGHEIRDVDVSDTRVILEGRRRGEELWTRVGFTADQARKAKIDLGGYPEDKLYARATTRLCRRKFADVVGGIAATIDELEDGEIPSGSDAPVPAPRPSPDPEPPVPAKRTAQRRTAPKKGATTRAATTPVTPDPAPAEPAPEDRPAAAPPPLPGDDDEEPARDDDGAQVSRDQLTKLHAQLGELNISERGDKLATVELLIQRQLTSSNDLTKLEASQTIDILARVLDSDDPKQTLEAVLGELES